MSSRALSFGVMAEAYERFRPGYPVELFDMVMTYAGQPVRTALEIGAGTGKATRLFAQRGVTVTATEPDGAMLAELLKHVPANVKTVQAAFEDLRPGESYGLVYAAAALHWTNPEGRWSRMAALLEPGGVFASLARRFGTVCLVGIEGTGSYGAGLTRHGTTAGHAGICRRAPALGASEPETDGGDRQAHCRARLRRAAPPLGRRTDLRLDHPLPAHRPRLRTATRTPRHHGPLVHDHHHDPAARTPARNRPEAVRIATVSPMGRVGFRTGSKLVV
jgi:SAM-dependent methyltransferase